MPIALTIYDGHMFNSRRQGASVAWRAPGPVHANLGGEALAKKAPHPHADMLLIDFMISKQGQTMCQEMGYATARKDMENAQKPEKALYLSERPNYATEFENWVKLARQIFGAGSKKSEK